MTTSHSLPVLVVGSGPSGLTAALSLAQNNIPIRIIDKVPEFHRASRGAGIQPRSMEVFQFLGIADDIRNLGSTIPPLRAYKLPGGTEVLRTWRILEPHDPTPDRPLADLCLSQYLTEDVFREHLAKHGIDVELSTELVTLEQDDEGVTATLKKTAPDGTETTDFVRAAYVIGADGARGATRRAIGASLEGETKDADGSVWSDSVVEGQLDHNYWHLWADGKKLTIPMRWNEKAGTYHIGIVGRNFDPIEMLDPVKFEEFFHEHTGRTDLVFKKIGALTYWKPKMRMIKKFCKGRVFIAGDAAHVHSPTGGQGLNTSVQDSFNLAWKLALVYKGLASPSILETYDTERLPVVKHMLATTSGLYKNLMVELGDRPDDQDDAQWRDDSLRQLEINYRWSPIVFDVRGFNGLDEDALKARAYLGYRGEDVRAGDRAPSASDLCRSNGVVTTLFDIFKPNIHTVLVFQPDTEATSAAAKALVASQWNESGIIQVNVLNRKGVPQEMEGARAYHDKEGYAYKNYHVDGSTEKIVIVRPDGYVGAFVDGMDGVKAYFSKILVNAY